MSSCELCVYQNCSNQRRNTFGLWFRNWMSSFVARVQSGRVFRSSEKHEFRETDEINKGIDTEWSGEQRAGLFLWCFTWQRPTQTPHVMFWDVFEGSVLHLLYKCFDFLHFILLLWFHSHLLPADWISLENQRRKWATSAEESESKKSPWRTFSQSWTFSLVCVCVRGVERTFSMLHDNRWEEMRTHNYSQSLWSVCVCVCSVRVCV